MWPLFFSMNFVFLKLYSKLNNTFLGLREPQNMADPLDNLFSHYLLPILIIYLNIF